MKKISDHFLPYPLVMRIKSARLSLFDLFMNRFTKYGIICAAAGRINGKEQAILCRRGGEQDGMFKLEPISKLLRLLIRR